VEEAGVPGENNRPLTVVDSKNNNKNKMKNTCRQIST
jgi:hypothetical protein